MKYLTISEFAEFSGLTRKTLIYYDRIGLLKPRVYGANGYRYYAFQQIDESYSIQTLRMLGVSIEEMKTYLVSMNADRAESLFKQKLVELETKKQEIINLQYYLKDRLSLIQKSSDTTLEIPFIETIDHEEYYLQSEPFEFNDTSIYATDAFGDFYNYLIEKNVFLAYNMALCTFLDNREAPLIAYLLRITPHDRAHTKGDALHPAIVREKGNYLSMYYVGDLYANYVHEKTLQTYASENDIQIETRFLHETIADEVISLEEDQRISKISVRVII